MLRLALAFACVVAAVPAHADHALILTNNRGLALGRPDLQYADDDGAKWLELFDALYGAGHTTLLTTFDAPTRTLFPTLVSRAAPPTKAALKAAFAGLAETLAAAPAGTRTATIVFAGHGDVADGEGFLELEDERLTATELEALLKALPAERIHLVIDACNAWFMLHPRKPGARRVVRKDIGDGLLERDKRIGALLSTSAEATTWEWSEIQSGLFSHALRSGLRGGADVDRDRKVSYRELDAFLAIANESVPEAYRPRLFVRAPKVASDAPFVALDGHTAKLVLPTARHIAVRDLRGVRLLDGHFEAGANLDLVVPVGELVIDEAILLDGRPSRRTIKLADSSEIGPLPADAPPPETAARGDAMRVEQLFATPFGKLAFDRWAAAPPVEEAPYGVSRADDERLATILASAARIARSGRHLAGYTFLGIGTFTALMGGAYLGTENTPSQDNETTGAVLMTTGVIVIGAGVFTFLIDGDVEDIYGAYTKAARDTELERASTVALFERRLAESAADYRQTRLISAWLLAGLAVGAITVGLFDVVQGKRFEQGDAWMLGSGGLFVGMSAYAFTAKHQVEEVWDLYQDLRTMPWQPGTTPTLSPVIAPLSDGLVLGLSGAF